MSGGGITGCECAGTGVPALIVPGAPHELRTAERLETQGCSVALEPGNTSAWYAERIGGILRDAVKLRKMSTCEKLFVDGKGARRGMEPIERLFAGA